MWRACRAAAPGPLPPEEDPWIGRFGDSAAMATQLLGLVLAGTKRATVGLVRDSADDGEPLPRIGGHWVACDGDGAPRCVLRTVELRLGPLAGVDDAFAWDEGEGDRTRAWWITAHLAYFRRTCAARGRDWSDELELVFERFRVVWPPEVADAPQAPSGPATAP
ncbi:MAG TPA: ASCH domain-containing protein [Geodermatophilus sp.]|nr:ASCH domain-containing protein [Geodermatophilus sp.]